MNYGEEHGIVFDSGGARFNGNNCTFKIKASVLNASGEVQSEEVENFKAYGTLYGLKEDDLGKTFRQGPDEFRITGAARFRRNLKYQIFAENTRTGRLFKFQAELVLQLLGRKVPVPHGTIVPYTGG